MIPLLIAAGSRDDTPALSVNVTNRPVSDTAVALQPASANAIAGVRSSGDGVLRTIVRSSANPVAGEWLASGSADDVQVYASLISGSTPGPAALNTWLDANTDRQYVLSVLRAAVGTTTASCVLRLTYRNKTTLATLGFADFNISVSATVETGE